LQRVVADVIIVVGNLHVVVVGGGGAGEAVEASHALVEMDNDVLARTILLTVEVFRHLLGALREAISKAVRVTLLRLDVKLILALEVSKVPARQLEYVGFLQFRYVLLAIRL
jgi:NADH dehydrogenase FAD-containing subunit